MPDEHVQFEEDANTNLLYSRMEASSKPPKMVEFIVRKGWAKDEKVGMWILLCVTGIAVLIAVTFPIFFGGSNENQFEKDPLNTRTVTK